VVDLAHDFGRAFGKNATWNFINSTGQAEIPQAEGDSTLPMSPLILIGTLGQSDVVDQLVWSGKIDVSSIAGKWESYISTVIEENPYSRGPALVIIGSDRRGTIYGAYDISEQIGVSPLYWWADVLSQQYPAVYALSTTKTRGPPTVKYRGFFINNFGPVS
jgi:hypothetical protein